MKEIVKGTVYLRLTSWGSITDDDEIFYNNLPFRMYFRNRRSRRFDTKEQLDKFFRQPVDESYPFCIDILER